MEITKINMKDEDIRAIILCLGNIKWVVEKSKIMDRICLQNNLELIYSIVNRTCEFEVPDQRILKFPGALDWID